MNLALDFIILLIFVFTVIGAYHKGFIKTVFDFLRGIISLIIACAFCGKLALWFEEHFLSEPIKNAITEKLSELSGPNSDNGIDISSFFENVRQDFVELVEQFGVTFSDVKNEYNSLENNNVENISESVVEYIANPVITAVATVISFIILFVLSLLLLKFLGWLIGLIFKLPILNFTNKVLGGILGVVMGLLFCLLFCTLFELIIPYLVGIDNAVFRNFNPYEGTYLFKFLCDFEFSDYLGNLILK